MHRFAVMPTMIVAIAGLGLLLSSPALPAAGHALATAPAGRLTPLVTHPTRTLVRAPGAVQFGVAFRIVATIQSSSPHPTGTCYMQEQLAWRWSTVARVSTTTGTCSARHLVSHRGTALLRVHFAGSRGWGSSTSTPITVVVH